MSRSFPAKLEAITDGDTIVMALDLGLRIWSVQPLRLLGINCPEKNTEAGRAARAFSQQWMSSSALFTVVTEKNPEKYGRWLATIFKPDSVFSLNEALLGSGNALTWSGKGVRPA